MPPIFRTTTTLPAGEVNPAEPQTTLVYDDGSGVLVDFVPLADGTGYRTKVGPSQLAEARTQAAADATAAATTAATAAAEAEARAVATAEAIAALDDALPPEKAEIVGRLGFVAGVGLTFDGEPVGRRPDPSNIGVPTISGTARAGETLSIGTGVWQDATSIERVLQRRISGGDTWETVGTVGLTRVVQAGSVGYQLRVREVPDGRLDLAVFSAVTPVVVANPTLTAFVALMLGQSQLNYLLHDTSAFRQIPSPTPGDGNLVSFTQAAHGDPIVKTRVDATTAGNVNPAIAAWSAFFELLMPGREIVIVDGAQNATGRHELMNDGDTTRRWSDLELIVGDVRADYDDFDAVFECWMANDVGTAKRMAAEWTPFYSGLRADGTRHELGTANPDSISHPTKTVDHCLWDADAPDDEYGRGLFRKDRTKWHILGWPSFNTASEGEAEMVNFTDRAGYPTQVDREARESMSALHSSAPCAGFAGYDGFSTHGARMTEFASSATTHPSVTHPDGQILMCWEYAVSIYRAAGGTDIEETTVGPIQPSADGTYADIIFDLGRSTGQLATRDHVESWITERPTLRELELLRIDPARTGCRLPDAALKQLGVDALPGGLSWNEPARTLTLSAGQTAAEGLIGWDLRGIKFNIYGDLGPIVDCRISSKPVTGANDRSVITILDVFENATIERIDWCTIEGEGYRNIHLTTPIKTRWYADEARNYVVPEIGRIHRCAFLKLSNDGPKTVGGGEISACYFDVPATVKADLVPYDPAETYEEYDYVSFGGFEYIAIRSVAAGDAPSGGRREDDNLDWVFVDPHADLLNPRAAVDAAGNPTSKDVWGCYFNMCHALRRVTDAGEPVGTTNGVRMSRNDSGSDTAGLDIPHGPITLRDSVIATMGFDPALGGRQVSYPLDLGTADGEAGSEPGWQPNAALRCHITKGNNDRWTREVDPAPSTITDVVEYDYLTAFVAEAPHLQVLTGFEIARAGGERRPVMRQDQTAYPASHRGRVYIVDTGAGPAGARTATARIVPGGALRERGPRRVPARRQRRAPRRAAGHARLPLRGLPADVRARMARPGRDLSDAGRPRPPTAAFAGASGHHGRGGGLRRPRCAVRRGDALRERLRERRRERQGPPLHVVPLRRDDLDEPAPADRDAGRVCRRVQPADRYRRAPPPGYRCRRHEVQRPGWSLGAERVVSRPGGLGRRSAHHLCQ